MSPILVRPVREQLEHDRVIRLLQAKYKRKYDVAINPGSQQAMPVGPGPSPWYPDLVLQSQDRAKKLAGVVEVETAESVNNLEAMSQWAALSKLRAPFHLYVPQGSIDTARRLCTDLQIPVSEVWAYHQLGDQMRFTLVQKAPGLDGKASSPEPSAPRPRAAAAPVRQPAARVAVNGKSASTARATAARPARRAASAADRKPAAKSRTTTSASRARSATPKAAPRSTARKAASRAQKRK